MLKVLLVDDENIILQGLSVIIDWEKEGFDIIGKASNGREALEKIKAENPDVVISDIRMPVMTGLELLEKVRKENISDANFIILTGFDDFEYARTALKNNALDYLLKPVEKDELLGALNKAKEIRAEKEKNDESEIDRRKEVFSRNIISIIKGKPDNDSVMLVKEHLGELSGVRYVSVELDETEDSVKEASDEKKRSMQKELYMKCCEITGDEFRCVFDVSLRGSYYDVGIIYSDELLTDDLNERSYLEKMKKELCDGLDFPIIINPGGRVGKIEELAESCKSVMLVNFIRGFEMSTDRSEVNDEWAGQGGNLDKAGIDELIHAVEINSQDEIKSGTKKMCEGLAKGESRITDMVINYLLFELMHIAREVNADINQEEIVHNIGNSAFDDLYLDGDVENMTKMLLNFSEYLVELRGDNAAGVLKSIEADMRENYKDNLTLKDFGKKYFVNAAYLGQLFKSRYGMSFKSFLHKIRIEKAEELLLHTDMKMYNIAEAVGYKDADYFINHFIAEKGCTPTKYRKQVNN